MSSSYETCTTVIPTDPRSFATVAEPSPAGSSSWYVPCKAVVDAVLAFPLLVLTSPMIMLLFVMVKLSSRGPILYTQIRLGHLGRPYTIYKIRTMFHECEKASGPQWSTVGDPRITPLGRWLRRCHLDELPQLWNVLRGEMSLVGPRPERPEFVTNLERLIPGYRTRLLVRPGITGLAQVQLPPDEDLASVRRKVACDAIYVTSIGPWLDLRIILGTVMKLIGAPFDSTRRLLGLPGGETESSLVGMPTVREEETASQLQTA